MGLKWVSLYMAGLLVISQTSIAEDHELTNFDCLIRPYLVADVSTREEGVVDEFLVDRGDLIEEDQMLVKLDAEVEEAAVQLALARTQMKADIDEKRTNLDFSRRHLKRITGLYENKGTTLLEKDQAATEALLAKLILQQAMHRKEVAELELSRAQELLKRRTIYSPITGVVLQRMLSPGETVNDRPIIRVAQINVVKVEVIIPVKYFGLVDVGMQAEVMPVYPGAKTRVATVTVVDRVVDAASDTFGVRLELQNPDLKIPAGVRCNILFRNIENKAVNGF